MQASTNSCQNYKNMEIKMEQYEEQMEIIQRLLYIKIDSKKQLQNGVNNGENN